MSRRWARVALLGAGVVLRPCPSLQSQQPVPHRDLLYTLRDTVTSVDAAVWEFNRDLRNAGRETVLGRAAFLRARCQSATVVLGSAKEFLRATTDSLRATRRATATFLQAMVRLEGSLLEQCERGFSRVGPGSWADTLRAWGPYRGKQIGDAIRAYEASATSYAATLGFRLEPKLPSR